MILYLIHNLLEDFRANDICYVHWKSNTNIDKALAAEDDLDILVTQKEKEKIKIILDKFNFLRAYSIKDAWQPEIIHYLGIDSESNETVHIHLHYGLVLGYDFDKNYKLPILDVYLSERQPYQNIYLPEVEKEYVVLILRLILKNALNTFLLSLPPSQLRKIKRAKEKIVKGGGYREFEDLKSRTNRDRLKNIITNELDILTWKEFVFFEKVLSENNNLYSFFKAGKKLKKILKPYQLKGRAVSNFKSFKRLNKIRVNTLFNKFKLGNKIFGKVNAEGGRIFAFVGGDGAGKSSTIKKISKVLSRHYKVYISHIGRPSKSLQGIFIRVVYKFTQAIRKKDLSLALQYLAIAYDRKNSFKKALKKRKEGYIVLQDRMPFPTITEMDCPRIHKIADGKFKTLAKKEREIYSSITGIDKMIVLRLNPEIALKRRPEDNPEELLKRSGNIWNNEWTAPYMFTVNTGEFNQNQVVGEILEEFWKSMKTPYKRVEIMGLNGTGKSTLSKLIAEEATNITCVISLKTYPLLIIKTAFFELFSTLKIYRQYKSKLITQAFFSLKVQLEILKKWKKQQKIIYKNFVIDQGPALGYVLAKKEGYWDDFFDDKDIGLINGFYKELIFLSAPYKTLHQRVRDRSQAVRSKELSLSEFEHFCRNYENAFQNLKDNTKVHILEFDTSKMRTKDIFKQIYTIR